jgi:hypothetical protein
MSYLDFISGILDLETKNIQYLASVNSGKHVVSISTGATNFACAGTRFFRQVTLYRHSCLSHHRDCEMDAIRSSGSGRFACRQSQKYGRSGKIASMSRGFKTAGHLGKLRGPSQLPLAGMPVLQEQTVTTRAA